MTIQMKVIKHYFPVVLFIMLYKVLLTFESVDEILISVSIQSYRAEIFCGYVITLYKFTLTFEVKKLWSSPFMW